MSRILRDSKGTTNLSCSRALGAPIAGDSSVLGISTIVDGWGGDNRDNSSGATRLKIGVG